MSRQSDNIIRRIGDYKFECMAGNLDNCISWQELKQYIDDIEIAFIASLEFFKTKEIKDLPDKTFTIKHWYEKITSKEDDCPF